MTPTPRALELLICRQVIVDSLTDEPTCVGIKTSLKMECFPSPPVNLAFFASLTDGLGDGDLELVITRLGSGETIYQAERRIHLAHRLAISHVYGNLPALTFPAADVYAISLLVDQQLAAIRHIRVREK